MALRVRALVCLYDIGMNNERRSKHTKCAVSAIV